MKHGANVNCVSDTGSTPVRSACFMTHLEIVQLLVQFSADIQRYAYNYPNENLQYYLLTSSLISLFDGKFQICTRNSCLPPLTMQTNSSLFLYMFSLPL